MFQSTVSSGRSRGLNLLTPGYITVRVQVNNEIRNLWQAASWGLSFHVWCLPSGLLRARHDLVCTLLRTYTNTA